LTANEKIAHHRLNPSARDDIAVQQRW